MDFVSGFPRTARGYNVVWVIVDRLTKSTHFLGMKTTDTTETLSQLYIVRLLDCMEFHSLSCRIVIPGLWHGSSKVYNKRWGQSYISVQSSSPNGWLIQKGDTGRGRHVTCLHVGLQGKLE